MSAANKGVSGKLQESQALGYLRDSEENIRGTIFDIQYGAMYDGPGLRTCIFFKGCPLRCRWCQNPESWLPERQISFFAEKCLRCGACVANCPRKALSWQQETLLRHRDKCNLCLECVVNCPGKAMELIGYETTPRELLEKALRDKPFYEKSGGGVTISGGEPLMQPAFLLKTLEVLRKEKIHTAVETCGYFKSTIIDALIEACDIILYDIKHIDSNHHKKYTGKDNRLIKKNFREIVRRGGKEKIIPRIPLIPGFNTDESSIRAIADFLSESNYRGEVHLMPYNHLTKTKWEKIGRRDDYVDFGEQSEEAIISVTRIFRDKELSPLINT